MEFATVDFVNFWQWKEQLSNNQGLSRTNQIQAFAYWHYNPFLLLAGPRSSKITLLLLGIIFIHLYCFNWCLAHLFVGEILDGLILLTKRGDSIYSCGKLKDLEEVMDSHALTFNPFILFHFLKVVLIRDNSSYHIMMSYHRSLANYVKKGYNIARWTLFRFETEILDLSTEQPSILVTD